MDAQYIIDHINDNILEIVSHYTDIKKKGTTYIACCPFHNEKTPSFHVSPSKGIFKCFGCGEGGDSITFIEKHEGVEFKEAVEIGAQKLNTTFEWNKDPDFNQEKYNKQQSLYIIMSLVADFFSQQLKTNTKAEEYIKSRDFGTEDEFQIGYAPKGSTIIKWAKERGVKQEILEELRIIKFNDERRNYYSFFRDRIMFPICSPTGKIIGFTGRDISDKAKAKYLNTPETDLFDKGANWYGLNVARYSIRKEDRCYIVEGNFDVIRLSQIGIKNTVAPCGTSLTKRQAEVLKKYTNKITLVYDGDSAGLTATKRNAEILIKLGFYVSVIILPTKEDPDSLFKTKEIFEEYNEKQEDYIIYKINSNLGRTKNPVYKSELIKETAALISKYESDKHEVYIEAASEIIRPRKAWSDALRMFAKNSKAEEKKVPKHIDIEELQAWGFYAENNCYLFSNKDKYTQRSNFIMTPLFHIESTLNAKRLYEVINKYGISKIVEIPQKDMVAIGAFKVRIESLGNFLWTGSDSDLNKLKGWLYEKTESCSEITQLGWQKEGFFCWGNGIFNSEEFQPANEYGIVTHNEKNYYIPACSKVYEQDPNLYQFERSFIFREGNITLREYTKKYTTVFGENGIITLCFLFSSLFLDIISRKIDKYPLLNLFGPKGAGKNACAESILFFFGKRNSPPNMHNTSKPAIADHVATSKNAVCILDEYRNDLEMEKRELLKGFWDKTGRTRMNMDKDKKKETTHVDQGIILCGQQMATADIALFSRFVVLSFNKTTYTDEEQQQYKDLEMTNKRGLTHLTHQILKCRQHFEDNYSKVFDRVSEEMNKLLESIQVETRLFNNWVTIISGYATLSDQLDLPFSYNQVLKIATRELKTQNRETSNNDDLGKFWETVQFLISSNLIFNRGDYKIEKKASIEIKGFEAGKNTKETIQLGEEKDLLYMTTTRICSLYKTQLLREGDKPLPESTIKHYLQHSKAFIATTRKESFQKIDPKTGFRDVDLETGRKKSTSTTAYIFDLNQIDLSIEEDELE